MWPDGSGGARTAESGTRGGLINVPQPLLPPDEGGGGAKPDEGACAKPASGVCAAFGKGSRWGTVTNLCTAIMGGGCLALPKAVADMGLVPFGVLIIFTGIATHHSIVLLVSAIDATGCRSFEDLTAQVIGKRMKFMVELSIIVFQYGSLVAYTIAIGDVLDPLRQLDVVQEAVPWLSRDIVIVGFWAVIMLPLSFVDRISDLQITSLIGQLSLLYLILAVSVHALLDLTSPTPPPGPQHPHLWTDGGSMALAHPTVRAISASAVIMFAFTCQVNVPSLYHELAHRSAEQMAAVSRRGVLLSGVCYCLIGIFGYADFRGTTQVSKQVRTYTQVRMYTYVYARTRYALRRR